MGGATVLTGAELQEGLEGGGLHGAVVAPLTKGGVGGEPASPPAAIGVELAGGEEAVASVPGTRVALQSEVRVPVTAEGAAAADDAEPLLEAGAEEGALIVSVTNALWAVQLFVSGGVREVDHGGDGAVEPGTDVAGGRA